MSMIEKVARAITDEMSTQYQSMPNGGAYNMERISEAAIEAMMEPTEEMTDVGENAAKIEYAGPDYAADAIYKSMLRQALKDT